MVTKRSRRGRKKAGNGKAEAPADPGAAVKQAEAALKAAQAAAAEKAAAEKEDGAVPAIPDAAQKKKVFLRLLRRVTKAEQSLGRQIKRLTKLYAEES